MIYDPVLWSAVIELVHLPPPAWDAGPPGGGIRPGYNNLIDVGHYCINLFSWCSSLQALGNHLGRWELLSLLIFSVHLSALTLSSEQIKNKLSWQGWLPSGCAKKCVSISNVDIFRYYETGTLTTPTPHPGRRGSWRRAPDWPPPRSATGSRTGGREIGPQKLRGNYYFSKSHIGIWYVFDVLIWIKLIKRLKPFKIQLFFPKPRGNPDVFMKIQKGRL